MHRAGLFALCLLFGTFATDARAWGQAVPQALLGELQWRLVGPFRGGRAVAVGGVAGSGRTFYFGAVDGGVWKSDDAGTVWRPLFDRQPVASIGALDVSVADPQVIYVGTGESDIRSNLASGAGVYRSRDGGANWSYVGLQDTRQISRLIVDPRSADTVYVGALGHAYGPNPERGVYKTTDGGTTWRHILDLGPTLGVADLALATQKPTLVFATVWNAHRPPWSSYAPIGGPGSGLYRSTDAGETWTRCNGHGLPGGTWGRSGVAVSADGQRVYALIDADHAGLYASDDGGENWRLVNDDPRLSSRAWYFSRITVDPGDRDTIYIPNVALYRSADGGRSLSVIRGAPGGDDYHELWVDPQNSDRLILGTDQGTVVSLNRGQTWSTWYNQPTAQLYHVITDDRFPYSVYAAEQDSGGVAVPSRTDHGEIAPRDWFPASSSESGYFALDPRDPDILYVSSYYGSVYRWDRGRSLSQDISPWPAPIDDIDLTQRKYRAPWTPPLVFSPADRTTLYFGTQYLLKTTDGGLHWAKISEDLTGARPGTVHPTTAPPASFDAARASGFGTLSTVAPAYRDPQVIWTGSDTGIISLTRDGGASWTNVTPPGLPAWARVSLIEPSHTDTATAYAAVERHRVDDRSPYLYRTQDYGRSWQAITTGLRAPDFVLAVREDPVQPGLLFAGTEFGIDVSFDAGNHWQPLQLNLPVTSVRDMAIHGNDLIAATHGRSIWILDDISPLRQAAAHATSITPFLYRPAAAVRIDNDAFPGTPLPREEPTAANPPSGATLDYYLPRDAPAVSLRILDAQNREVRRFSSTEDPPPPHPAVPIAEQWFPPPPRLAGSAGMHRFVWSLASANSGEIADNAPDDGDGDVPRAPRVPPGTYTIELAVNGETVSREALQVTQDPRSAATADDLARQFDIGTRIFRDCVESRRALAEIDTIVGRLKAIVAAAPHGKRTALHAADADIARIRAITGGANGLAGSSAALVRALQAVESADRPVPSQVLAAYESAQAAAHARLEQWAAIKTRQLATLNSVLNRSGLSPMPIREIEREIDHYLTR
jgi:photosystem II stability/assembly factor-like uncharacterized protein